MGPVQHRPDQPCVGDCPDGGGGGLLHPLLGNGHLLHHVWCIPGDFLPSNICLGGGVSILLIPKWLRCVTLLAEHGGDVHGQGNGAEFLPHIDPFRQ
jgi:hypothetical protein